MKKYLHLLILCFFIVTCDDCFIASGSFGEFNIYKKQIELSVAQGDSIMLDLNKIWGGTRNCEKDDYYNAEIGFASLSNDIITVRDIYQEFPNDNYIIIRALKKGTCTITLYGISKGSSDDCEYSNVAWNQPVTINVTVGYVTDDDLNGDLIFEPLVFPKINTLAPYIRVEPSEFSKGDTIMVYYDGPNNRPDWIFPKGYTKIVGGSFFSYCSESIEGSRLQIVALRDTIPAYIRTYVEDSILSPGYYYSGERIQLIGSTTVE
jgi:hypothetical protein